MELGLDVRVQLYGLIGEQELQKTSARFRLSPRYHDNSPVSKENSIFLRCLEEFFECPKNNEVRFYSLSIPFFDGSSILYWHSFQLRESLVSRYPCLCELLCLGGVRSLVCVLSSGIPCFFLSLS